MYDLLEMTSSVKGTTSGGGGGGGGSGSRWCPTPEQVMLLEGMYKGGLKTPSATQIQQITARLSIYGKIQGKNVFYWFQNHKARDRQKLRKKLMALYHQHRFYPPHNPFLPTLDLHHQMSDFEEIILGGGVEVEVEDASSSSYKGLMMNNNNWKVPSSSSSDENCKFMCDCSLMSNMMMKMDNNHGTTPYCTRVPPKTLQLFPVTTDLKDDDNHGTTPYCTRVPPANPSQPAYI